MDPRTPDGKQMEPQVDCFDSNEAANAGMHGPQFSANAIRVEYHPEAWVARRPAGAPVTDFLARDADAPESPPHDSLTA